MRFRSAICLVSIFSTLLWLPPSYGAEAEDELQNDSDETAIAHVADQLQEKIDAGTTGMANVPCRNELATGTLLDNLQLSQLPVGTSFQIMKDLQLNIARSGRKLDPGNTTLFFSKGELLGSSDFYLPLAYLNYPITRDTLKSEVIAPAIGQSSPDSGTYCFLNTSAPNNLSVKGNTVTIPKGRYSLKGCTDKKAVGSVEGGKTTTYSFNFFGKTNESTLSVCYMTREGTEKDASTSLSTFGCVAYRSDKTPNTDDFLSAAGMSSSEIRIADPRSADQIAADKAKAAEAKRIADRKAAEKAAKEAAEEAKRREEHNAISERYEASRKWSDEALRKMPRYDDPRFLKLVEDQPKVKQLHEACLNDYLTGSLKFTAMPPSCVEFFQVWQK